MEIAPQKGFITERPNVQQGQYGPYATVKFATYKTVKKEDGSFGKKPIYWIGLAGKQAAQALMNAVDGSEIFIASGSIESEKQQDGTYRNNIRLNEVYLTGGMVGQNRQQQYQQPQGNQYQQGQQGQMFPQQGTQFQGNNGGQFQAPPPQVGMQPNTDTSDLPF